MRTFFDLEFRAIESIGDGAVVMPNNANDEERYKAYCRCSNMEEAKHIAEALTQYSMQISND